MNRTSDEPNKPVDEGAWPFLLQNVEANAQDALNLLGINLECARVCLAQADKSGKTDELDALLRGASVACNRLERMQDQLFRLVEWMQGMAKPVWQRVELGEFLREICATAQPIRQNLGVELVYEPAESLQRCEVAADPIWLQQIVLQLLSNALRACKPGGRVCIRLEEEEKGLCLRMTDDGCGLQGSAAQGKNRERFVGGAGLGLRLCGAYCALLGWTLELNPRRTGGTEAVLHILRDGPQQAQQVVQMRSGRWEEETRRQQMQYAVRRELRSVPGLEEAEFELYAEE
jgi:signal transduction histidine kinase